MGKLDQHSPLAWRKSTFSGANECVEVAFAGQSVLVRDSKTTTDLPLRFSAQAWRNFLADLKVGSASTSY